jgi:hypothetical protein
VQIRASVEVGLERSLERRRSVRSVVRVVWVSWRRRRRRSVWRREEGGGLLGGGVDLEEALWSGAGVGTEGSLGIVVIAVGWWAWEAIVMTEVRTERFVYGLYCSHVIEWNMCIRE